MKKRVLSLLLTVVMMVSLLPNALAAKQPTFTDVAKDMWCFDYVEFVAEKGYFKGTTATTFNPNGTMTRQQFVTVLARMAGVKVDNSKTAFTDVPAGSYSAGSVAWAAKEGIVTGYADGTFHPTAPVTRQQMCAFMSRFMDYYAEAHGVYFLKKAKVSSFVDYNQVADYAKTAVDRCRAYGLIQGYAEDNTFRPANSATRAHVAAVIYRLAMIIQQVAGGGPGGQTPPPPPPPITTPVTYTLTYKNENVVSGSAVTLPDSKTNTDGYADFVVKGISAVDSNVVDGKYNGKKFVEWVDAADASAVYAEGETIRLTADKTLKAKWVDLNDLLYWAIHDSAAEALGKANTMAGKVDAKVPYAALNTLTVEVPETITNNTRTVSVAAEAELSTDIISRLVETATYYAVNLIGTPAEFVAGSAADQATQADAISQADVEQIVSELLDVIDPSMTWWEGATRTEKIKNLASKVYNTLKDKAKEGKDYAGLLWNDNFKYNGAVLFTEADLVDNNGNVVVTAKADKKLYDAADNQLSYKKGVALIAKAVAKELYADLKTQTSYVYDLSLSGKLGLNFTMNEAQNIDDITAGYPTTYYVAADLTLAQEPDEYNGQDQYYLAYKFENGRPYVKLIVNALMQAEYEQSVNAIAQAAMTNGTLKAELSKRLIDMLVATICDADRSDPNDTIGKLLDKLMDYDAEIAADLSTEAKAEAYVLKSMGIAKNAKGEWALVKNGAVDLWLDENLSTLERGQSGYPSTAPYYLPFDFFWNVGGTVNPDGTLNIPTRAATYVLGNNEDLVDAVELLITEVINSVAAPVLKDYEDDYGIVFDSNMRVVLSSIETVLQTKVNEKLPTATVESMQTDLLTSAKDEFGIMKSNINTEGKKIARKIAVMNGQSEAAFNNAWTLMTPAQRYDLFKDYLDVDQILTDLFGTADGAALTIAGIDAAANYVPGDYPADIESQVQNAATTAELKNLMPAFAEMIKAETSVTLYQIIDDKVEEKLTDLISTNTTVADMLNGDIYSRTYLKALVMSRMGFVSFIDEDMVVSGTKTLKEVALENMAAVIDEKVDTKITEERNKIIKAEDVEALLNDAVAKACGTYSKYLNQIGTAKTFDSMFDKVDSVKVQKFVDLLKRDDVMGKVTGKIAPKYVQAIAKAISKIEDNASSITINGVTVTGMNDKVQAVKNAGNAKALYNAVVDFLAQWGEMTIADFADADGVAVDVVASAKGYTYSAGANFVIEVQ